MSGITKLGALLVVSMMFGDTAVFGQDKNADKKVLRLLNETIHTDDFQTEMPLGKYLKALEAKAPADSKIQLKFDEEGFGKDAAKLLATPIKLPPYPKRMSLGTGLRIALAKLNVRIEMCAYPTHLAITTPERASYTLTYDFRDVIRDTLPKLKGVQEIPAGEETQWLFNLLSDWIEFSNLEIRNGTQVVLHTTWRDHMTVPDFKAMLLRLTDVAVVMHSRMFEVDRDFFEKNVAPLLIDPRDKVTQRLWGRVSPELAAALRKQQHLLDGDDAKFYPKHTGLFLARQHGTRYRGEPAPEKDAPVLASSMTHAMALSGVSFRVRPEVSSDRRRIKLHITQTVAELAGIGKAKVVDPKTGKEAEVESPNLRKSSSSVEMVIWDGQPIVLPVGYRSAEARAKDRQWVVLARPIIYIEEEEEQVRKAQLAPVSPEPEPEPKVKAKEPTGPKAPARSEKVEQLLEAVVRDVLQNRVKDYLQEKTFPVKRSFVLEDTLEIAWPSWFHPGVQGFDRYIETDDDLEFEPARRILIRLVRFDPERKDDKEAAIEVECYVRYLGSRTLSYRPKRQGNRWTVECVE